jgi:hypothetical protein
VDISYKPVYVISIEEQDAYEGGTRDEASMTDELKESKQLSLDASPTDW